MHRFEELDVWKKSAGLSSEIYKILSNLTDFGFRDQMTRSGLSIPSNIAEGYERGSRKETIHFLQFAKGSAGELRTQVLIGMKIGYIEKTIGKKWKSEVEEISKMLQSLIRKLKSSHQSKN